MELIFIIGYFISGFLVGFGVGILAVKKYIERKLDKMGLGGFMDGF